MSPELKFFLLGAAGGLVVGAVAGAVALALLAVSRRTGRFEESFERNSLDSAVRRG